MAITDVISVVKSANTRTPTRQGFGRAAVFAYHTLNTDVFRIYSSLSAMVADGFSTVSPAYKKASAAFQQTPRPTDIMVVRAPAATDTKTITITSATAGDVISFDVINPAGTVTTVTRTVPGSSTLTAEATAVAALIAAITGMGATASVANISVTTSVTGGIFHVRNPKKATVLDTAADPGYAAALATLLVATTDFYFVTAECNSPLAVTALRAACETAGKLFLWQTNSTIEKSASALFLAQKALSPSYGGGFFVYDTNEWAPDAAAAVCGTRDPGSYSLNLKALVGVTPVPLTDTETAYLKTQNANFYVLVANGISGVLGTNGGFVMSGGSFIDIIHGTDWFVASCQVAVLAVQANQDKIDYTEAGVALLTTALKSVCTKAERQRLFAPGSSVVQAGLVSAQSTTDKGNRYFGDLQIGATYAGAIHSSKLQLTLTF